MKIVFLSTLKDTDIVIRKSDNVKRTVKGWIDFCIENFRLQHIKMNDRTFAKAMLIQQINHGKFEVLR